ncbi:MAG: leucine-rich repeat-containing serine/threonine-protein kinase [Sulfurovum sp.]|nr:leucine-rich repeat-containing serine/threonine-protein kinase [Sulfurovum sp.]
MQTLKQLKSGQLTGAKELKLCENLTAFPHEILTLADTLERLDMTGNALDALPDDFHKLTQLKILFLSDNNFTELPAVLAKCPNLSMIGFRNNRIETVPENALPLSTRWLILTDNAIKSLPESMGNLTLLQKCMLSGNQLTFLPESMVKCHNLELLRIAVNKLEQLPLWLLTLPKLSWLAYGGNPFCAKHPNCNTALKEIGWDKLELGVVLGEGASGLISKARYDDKEVAVKVFKGDITSDGLPQEEMDINISMGQHPHLVDVLAKVTGHPEGKDVLMLELIPSSFFNLGLPPTFESCSRDVYPDTLSFTLHEVLKILKGIASAATHMHERGIMHGDFYAHNIMIDKNANSILGDFGGASYYEPTEQEVHQALERLEVRAFGYLTEELLSLSEKDNTNQTVKTKLNKLKESCLTLENKKRPLFLDIEKYLASI